MGILEKIAEIEREIARTQKNKGRWPTFNSIYGASSLLFVYITSAPLPAVCAATEYHLGLLKAKLAKYRAQLLEPPKSASSKVLRSLRWTMCIDCFDIPDPPFPPRVRVLM